MDDPRIHGHKIEQAPPKPAPHEIRAAKRERIERTRRVAIYRRHMKNGVMPSEAARIEGWDRNG